MTNPGQGEQWPNQQGGWPPQYGGQPYGTPPTPQYGTPQQPYGGYGDYGQPGQPGGYGQPGGTNPYGQPAQYGGSGAPPRQPRSRRGLIIALVAALVVLAGGGATWFALSQSDSVAAGADTPEAAARHFTDSLTSGDLVGMLGTLEPTEAKLFTDPVKEATEEFKRLGVFSDDADPSQLSGLTVRTEGLGFDKAASERVNDHVTITKLDRGRITVTGDAGKLPLSPQYRELATAESGIGDGDGPETQTIDLADVARSEDGPLRIATVNVDGEWYPSLLYSIADYALLDEGAPWPSKSVPAVGADSPDAAVKDLLQAAFDSDLRRVIELTPPDEMGVLHDVGPVLIDEAGSPEPSGVTVVSVETENSDIEGGTRAAITKLELEAQGQGTMRIVKDGDCYRQEIGGSSRQLCGADVANVFGGDLTGMMPPAARQAAANVTQSVLEQGIGVVTTEVDGQHYVSPVRTLTELAFTFLRGLTPEDFTALTQHN